MKLYLIFHTVNMNFIKIKLKSFWLTFPFTMFEMWNYQISGSIAEREHMKWRNAVELPNNPYSAEALQRRLSQSSNSKFIDIERLTSKFEANIEANIEAKRLATSKKIEKPMKVVLGSKTVNTER